MVLLVAFLLSFSLVALILSVPSFIIIFRNGYKLHISNIRFLYKEYKNLKTCYNITANVNYNFVYSNGHKINKSIMETKYYLPLVSDNLVYIIETSDIFYQINITKYDYNSKSWDINEFKIKYSSCIYTMFLYDRFIKRVKKLANSSSSLKNIEELNNLINSDIKTIRRESKLNLIFNE